MQYVYTGLFVYPNLGSGTTRCYLQVYYQRGEPLVAVVTELLGNDGTSVTNAIEAIALLIRQQFRVAHEDLMVFEYAPARGHIGGRVEDLEIFSRVHFQLRGGVYRHPRWTHVARAALEVLIDQPFRLNI
jgi:hypothetical protein